MYDTAIFGRVITKIIVGAHGNIIYYIFIYFL
jgi:hypothetical protein